MWPEAKEVHRGRAVGLLYQLHEEFQMVPILQTRILMLTEAKCVASHNLALSIWTEIPGAEVQPLTLTASNNHLVVLQWEALRKFRRLALQTSISLSVNQPSSCTCSLSPSPCLLLLLCVCACSLMYTRVKPWLWTCYVSYQWVYSQSPTHTLFAMRYITLNDLKQFYL